MIKLLTAAVLLATLVAPAQAAPRASVDAVGSMVLNPVGLPAGVRHHPQRTEGDLVFGPSIVFNDHGTRYEVNWNTRFDHINGGQMRSLCVYMRPVNTGPDVAEDIFCDDRMDGTVDYASDGVSERGGFAVTYRWDLERPTPTRAYWQVRYDEALETVLRRRPVG